MPRDDATLLDILRAQSEGSRLVMRNSSMALLPSNVPNTDLPRLSH
jgi:hypothetical protein